MVILFAPIKNAVALSSVMAIMSIIAVCTCT